MPTFGDRFYEEHRPRPYPTAPANPYPNMEQMPTYGAGQHPSEQLSLARAQWLSELFDMMEYRRQAALANMQKMFEFSGRSAPNLGSVNPGGGAGYNSSPAKAVVGEDGVLQWSQTGPTSGGAIQETRGNSPGGGGVRPFPNEGTHDGMRLPADRMGPLPSMGRAGVRSAFPGMNYGPGRGRMGGGAFGGFGRR